MSIAANVKSIQALADLKTALLRYNSDVQETLHQVKRTIDQTRQSLVERQNYWRGQVRRCEETLQQARAALTRCQNSAYTDRDGRRHVPDCRGIEEQVAQAKRRLDEALHELRTVEQAIKAVETAVQSYEQQAHRLAGFVNNDLKQGEAMLERKIAVLQGYATGEVIGGVVGLVPTNLFNNGSTTLENSLSNVSGWQEMGIQEIALTEIDLSDSYIQSTDDFKKVSRDTMLDGLEKLQSTVRPAVATGKDGDYFYELDAQLGLAYQNGYRRVYDAFYGDEPIRLEKVNGRYQVINGYHRLFVAKELGLTTVPASVTSQNEENVP